MPTTLTNGIQLPDKGSVDWYSSMQSNYNLIDTHLGNTDTHVTAEDKANWNSKQGSLSQAQLDAIAQVATNTNDIASLQSDKANASHTHSSSDITDIGDYATKQYVDNSISGLVDNAPDALNTLNELSAALNDDNNFASTVTTALAAKADSADLAAVATSGDYDDLSNKPSIPTNTSDLNNDSNFVDTSNPAVASGITSAKVTSYDSHIADTDIHVTTADKTKWNAVSSKANDSDVVHKSGDETVGGVKTFSDNPVIGNNNTNITISNRQIIGNSSYSTPTGNSYSYMQLKAMANYTDSSPSIDAVVSLSVQENAYSDGKNRSFSPSANNVIDLGLAGKRWANVYATNYYYGGSEIEFSQKFVTTDTNQTISGQKVFTDINAISNSSEIGVSGGNNSFKVLDKNKKTISRLDGGTFSTGMAYSNWLVNNGSDVFNGVSLYQPSANLVQLRPYSSELSIQLGASIRSFSDCYTSKINGLTPSSLGMPVIDRTKYVDISGYFTNTGNGDINTYSVTANGWIYLRLTDIGGCQLSVLDSSNNRLYGSTSSGNLEQLCLPVTAGTVVETQWTTSTSVTVAIARFIPCQGNI